MTDRRPIGRDDIVRVLVEAIEPLDFVHAMWEGGAIAFDRLDEWSDIDILVDAEDDRATEVFPIARKALETLSPIDLQYEVLKPTLGEYVQTFYRLRDASRFLLIDLAIFKHSAPDKLLEPEIHGKAVFHFNKHNAVGVPALDRDGLLTRMRARVERLERRFDMFSCFVEKELNRGNAAEALSFYHRMVLESLVLVLRLKHSPARYDFGTRYVYHDLPASVASRIEELYFVSDVDDLEAKYRAAERWFHQALTELDFADVQRKLKTP
jgi:predicted nucleotidyltransferase